MMPARAANELVLLPDAGGVNRTTLITSGSGNLVLASQEDTMGADTLAVVIAGNRNGGGSGLIFTGPLAAAGLVGGAAIQGGSNNSLLVEINGDANLFSFQQAGLANRLTASIAGNNNQVAVTQTGVGNSVTLSQTGANNVVDIEQR
jgi:hypothetical protein